MAMNDVYVLDAGQCHPQWIGPMWPNVTNLPLCMNEGVHGKSFAHPTGCWSAANELIKLLFLHYERVDLGPRSLSVEDPAACFEHHSHLSSCPQE